MTEEQVVELMESCQTEQEWNNNCDKVKKDWKSNNPGQGDYPPFWFTAIILSGLHNRVTSRFRY